MDNKSEIESTYDISRSYEENFNEGPFFSGDMPEIKKGAGTRFLDFEIDSPIGVPAGLLLNSKWVSLYSRLGFDILTYKTVRSEAKKSHPVPNCLLLDIPEGFAPASMPGSLRANRGAAVNQGSSDITITNSFGMPSLAPDLWQADVERARRGIKKGQILVVSVVGGGSGSENSLIDDYERTALMAKEAGADIIEVNLSCPNVNRRGGELYKDAQLAGSLTGKIHKRLAGVPLFIKTGFYDDFSILRDVLKATARNIEGIAGINSVKMKVLNEKGEPALGIDRPESGVCGGGIFPFGADFIKETLKIRREEGFDFAVVATGGVTGAGGFDRYLEMGADLALSCTGAMFFPQIAAEWKKKRFTTFPA